MDRSRLWIAAALVAVAGSAWWVYSARVPEPPPLLPVDAPAAAAAPASILVHVAGAVVSPGVVALAPDSRLADAVAAAGGFTDAADPAAVNLAAPLVDGQHVLVPERGAVSGPTESGGPLRINSASAAQLEELPGVGPVLAERIVAHREAHGPFVVIEDLLDVPGIGEAKLEALRDLVQVP